MADNLYDNKVSEKVVWEGTITHEDDVHVSTSQSLNQQQMMFCYKCNNVIPGDSIYCPYCQIKLLIECPVCGLKHSSQYPVCNKCGTNREEYFKSQRLVQERKIALEREKKRQIAIEEHKKNEEERLKKEEAENLKNQKRIEAIKRKKEQKKKEITYIKENIEIMKTEEYKTIYSFFYEALKKYQMKNYLNFIIMAIIFLSYILMGIGVLKDDLFTWISILSAQIINVIYTLFLGSPFGLKRFLLKLSTRKNNCDRKMTTYVIKCLKNHSSTLDNTYNPVGDLLSALDIYCIDAYRKKNGLSIMDIIHSESYTDLD